MNKEENSWKDWFRKLSTQTIAMIIAVLITPLIYVFRDYIGEYFYTAHFYLSEDFQTNLYVILTSFIIGMLIFYLYSLIKGYTQKTYRDYKKDMFFDVNWVWDYKAPKEVRESSVQPICPKCNSKMDLFDNSLYLDYARQNGENLVTFMTCKNRECDYNETEKNEFLKHTDVDKEYLVSEIVAKIDKSLRDKRLKS